MKKFVMLFFALYLVLNVLAQKNLNLDELNVDQLNLYMNNATSMRNAGIALTVIGTGVAILGASMINSNYGINDLEADLNKMGSGVLICTLGVISTGVGIPLWVIGGKRRSQAELILKKYDFKQGNSMAVGVGLTLRF